jgi:hypothetical protein
MDLRKLNPIDLTTAKGKLVLAAIVLVAFFAGTNLADEMPWTQVSVQGHCRGLEGKALSGPQFGWFRQNCVPQSK